jgi:choline dehydrogenase
MPETKVQAMSADAFDYVIVGGGAAGCVLAARLSESPGNRVALIEAGGDRHSLWVGIPAAFGKTWKDKRFNWNFAMEPEEGVHGRAIPIPRGKSLGGSTLINGMIYVRGQRQDYDDWAQRGATGWSFDDVLPYFRKLENYREAGEGDQRGRGGPLDIVQVSECHAIPDAFIDAGVEAGFPRNPDYNGEDQEGFGYYQVAQRGGRRWSAFDSYLRPAMTRPNLTVITHAHATRLVIEGRRVVGVTYRRDGAEQVVRARGEVVLAAGAIQTPHLLELSGIGNPEVLGKVGIDVIHALPGVGRNYQDHFATRMNWRVKDGISLNEHSRGWRLGLALAQFFLRRRGILTLGTGIAHGFVRTRPELETPDVQYFFVHASYANAADRVLDREPGMTIGVAQLRPQSRGTIHIKSPDPMVPPAIRPNLLGDRIDRETLVAGMKLARVIIDQPAMDRFRDYEMNPGPGVSSDDQWLDYARRTGQTIYHPIGTCGMGTGPDAVVDPQLRLHGLDGLRIADASVMPAMVSANTQAAVMMIAEKAADLIKSERQLQDSN